MGLIDQFRQGLQDHKDLKAILSKNQRSKGSCPVAYDGEFRIRSPSACASDANFQWGKQVLLAKSLILNAISPQITIYISSPDRSSSRARGATQGPGLCRGGDGGRDWSPPGGQDLPVAPGVCGAHRLRNHGGAVRHPGRTTLQFFTAMLSGNEASVPPATWHPVFFPHPLTRRRACKSICCWTARIK